MSYKREIILNTFQELTFNKFGKNPDGMKDLKADASERRIYRLFIEDKSLIGIYNENEKENLAFINFTKSFIELGFNVPEVICVSDDNLFYLEEDLGDITLFSLTSNSPNENHLNYFKQALADLIRFQVESKDKLDFNYCYQTKEFNADVVESDMHNFNDYYAKNNFDQANLQKVVEYSNAILKRVRNDFFLYRDFQPRNIMIKDNLFYYIDYQSGRKGPLQYDVASFLYSGSINISENERNILLNFYIDELKKYIRVDKEEFLNYFYHFVFLRLLQMLGSYSYLNMKRKDKEVLKKIPKALVNLETLKDKIENKKINKFISELTSSKF